MAVLLWTLALCFHSLCPELGLLTKPVPLQTRLSREPRRTCIRILIREPDQSDSSESSQSAGRAASPLLLLLRERNQRLPSQAAAPSGSGFESAPPQSSQHPQRPGGGAAPEGPRRLNQQPGPVSPAGAGLPSDDVTGGRGLPPGLQEAKASGVFTAELQP